MSGEIEPRVRRFLGRHINRVEQLEILLLLQQFADRSWSAAEVAGAVRLHADTVAEQLEALGRGDLLDVRLGSEVRYRYSPASEELAADVRQVAEAYRHHRGPVLAFVMTRRDRSLRDFVEAFKIGRDAQDG